MENCLFCKIVNGDIPAYKIDENKDFIAFLDITPYCEGHTLVIPKKHYRWMWDMPEDELTQMILFSKKLAKHFQKTTGKEEVFTFLFGEMVPHAHYHLLPNVEGHLAKHLGELSQKARLNPTSEELDKVYEKMRVQ